MLYFDDGISNLQSGAGMQLSDRIGRRMKLQHLHVLMTVVQAGSMEKAAAAPKYLPTRHFQIDRGTGT